jgi:hypothetical protein
MQPVRSPDPTIRRAVLPPAHHDPAANDPVDRRRPASSFGEASSITLAWPQVSVILLAILTSVVAWEWLSVKACDHPRRPVEIR